MSEQLKCLRGGCSWGSCWMVYTTADAANLALGRAIVQFAHRFQIQSAV